LNLDDVISNAERLKFNLEASQQFNKNIRAFERLMPAISAHFENYKLEEMRLEYFSEYGPNIRNKDGRLVYPEAPQSFAVKQVEKYKKDADFNLLVFNKIEFETGYIHQDMMSSLFFDTQEYKKEYLDLRFLNSNVIHSLLVFGVGLGHHLQKLCTDFDVRNLNIYEPNEDIFFISLHVFDWAGFLGLYNREGYNLELVIGVNEDRAYQQLTMNYLKIGFYNMSFVHMFKHYSSSKIDALYRKFKQDLNKVGIGMGFYDDEKVGLVHTLEKSKYGVLPGRRSLTARKDFREYPVVVIGNGPSLDLTIDFIRDIKDKAILISCGTALHSLEKYGLKPDVHVENERPYATFDWLSQETSADFRKDIVFVGLNVVHPKVHELFERSYMIAKPNDLGGQFLVDSLEQKPGNSLLMADFCGPTCTNFGGAVAVAFGFDKVILAGVDYGMPERSKHHSIKSPHMKSDYKNRVSDEYKVEGNLRPFVLTTSVLHKSLMSFEDLIKKYGFKCLNINDGSKIHGATPCRVDDLDTTGMVNIDKKMALNSIIGKVFYAEGINTDFENTLAGIDAEIQRFFGGANKILSHEISVIDDFYLLARDIYALVRGLQKTNHYAYGLIKGSVDYFLSASISRLSISRNSFVDDYRLVRSVFERFSTQVIADMADSFYRVDEWSNYSDSFHTPTTD